MSSQPSLSTLTDLSNLDIDDRRFLAQCTQHLSSSALAALLDLLLLNHPTEVVERKGGESYHIDFGTLSSEAYAIARKFIKQAVKDDDECAPGEGGGLTPSLSILPTPNISSSSLPFSYLESSDSLSSAVSASINNGSNIGAKRANDEKRGATLLQTTPLLPHPNATVASVGQSGNITGTGQSLNSMTVSPEKNLSRLKRPRHSTPSPELSTTSESPSIEGSSSKKEESRYYNGERIWRKATSNATFNFHGVDVVLLGQHNKTNRPWQCMICKKSFVSKDKIVNHVQQHSGEKLHECQTCHGKFSSKHYLKEHQKRVHQYDCHHCKEVFLTFEDLHEHSLTAHPQTESKNCSCRKGCNNSRCSCFKNGLNCTLECQCSNCNNMA